MSPFLAGFFLDANNRVVLAAISGDVIGLTLTRFDHVPPLEEIQLLTEKAIWLLFRRSDGYKVSFSSDPPEDIEAQLRRPEGRETLSLGVSLGLFVWPEWCPDLRDSHKPRWFIPLQGPIDA